MPPLGHGVSPEPAIVAKLLEPVISPEVDFALLTCDYRKRFAEATSLKILQPTRALPIANRATNPYSFPIQPSATLSALASDAHFTRQIVERAESAARAATAMRLLARDRRA